MVLLYKLSYIRNKWNKIILNIKMKKETRNFVSNKRNTDNLFKKIGISKYADDNFKLNKNKIKKKTFQTNYIYKKKREKEERQKKI